MRKLLVANRGEIAVRVMRTARALGLRTVAVYSDADRDAPHVGMADEAVHIGAAPPRESYLSIDRLLAACARTGADALHPGYGFLAENAELAERCTAAGVRFVGPPAAAIRAMGDKAAAKRRMLEAGVPVVPGYQGHAQDDATLAREAERVGFPLLVKAAAGGGGRGMRIVREAASLAAALASARAEAQAAFGNGELLLERLVEGARHIELQVFGDVHGHVIHLGERECSAQRRHQKVIEESPSPVVDEALRARMGEAAVKAARAVGYVGAGTVELLVAPDRSFYFMEMNTRLQVEHPVTELVTGLDLVAWQLAIAGGAELPLAQGQVRQRGHAIEARLYAEDPYSGFLPQAGRLLRFLPPAGEGIRVDSGVREGGEVTPFYDPMIAKVIAHGETRELARRRLARALEHTVVLGITTNREFLVSLLEDDVFVAGELTTGTIDERFATAPPARPQGGPGHAALAAVLLSRQGDDAWNSTGVAAWTVKLAEIGLVQVRATGAGAYEVTLGAAAPVRLRVLAAEHNGARVEIDDVQQTAAFAREGDVVHVQLAGVEATYREQRALRSAEGSGPTDGRVTAPITGQVLSIATQAGEQVARGQVVVVLTAMKMEHRVLAPVAGRVHRVAVAAGAQVAARQLLVELEPAAESGE